MDDPEADFQDLYVRYRAPLFRAAYGVLLDRGAAEDAVHDAFQKAWQHRDELARVRTPKAWLYSIAIRTAISQRRRRTVRDLLPDRLRGRASAPGADEMAEANVLARQALSVLSSKQRAVVVLHYYGGLTRGEIAAALDIPAGSVASRMSDALKAMRSVPGLTDA